MALNILTLKTRRTTCPCALFALLLMAGFLGLSCTRSPDRRSPFIAVRTLAGTETGGDRVRFDDTFGVAAAEDGTVYVTDGDAGLIVEIAPDGSTRTITEKLRTPSAIAVGPDNTLIVADTGSHTIKRIEVQSGGVTIIAGIENQSGFADGNGASALFNGPIGLALSPDGTILVADTYNDRIRAIDGEGRVRTLAGGDESGYRDATIGADARFNTPCGIAVDLDGTIMVADTGNHRLRRVYKNGAVSTVSGPGAPHGIAGTLKGTQFNEPVGLAIDVDGTVYVADAGGSSIHACHAGFWGQASMLVGQSDAGLTDGQLELSRLSRPSSVAVGPDGTLLVADSGNRLVRAVVREGNPRGIELSPAALEGLRPKAAGFRQLAPARWPYDPPDRAREIAATFGEVRGEVGNGENVWFHNGLDIPGAYGETVRTLRSEKILRPLAVDGVGGPRERIRFPTLGYIHLRVGRDKDDIAFDDKRFTLERDEEGNVMRVRVRRGAHFKAGEAVGTLNNQNHVHLIAGYAGSEFNALAALELPGVKDTVAPVIEKDGVRLFDDHGKELGPHSVERSRGDKSTPTPITLRGKVRIVVRAYDQMDGNASRRRLGLYRLGYQVLTEDLASAPGFKEPLVTISFENLPDDGRSAPIAYAEGSKAGPTGETVLAYIVTNVVRDREAKENYWHTSELPAGEYVLRVFAEDFFGNRTTRDTRVRLIAAD